MAEPVRKNLNEGLKHEVSDCLQWQAGPYGVCQNLLPGMPGLLADYVVTPLARPAGDLSSLP